MAGLLLTGLLVLWPPRAPPLAPPLTPPLAPPLAPPLTPPLVTGELGLVGGALDEESELDTSNLLSLLDLLGDDLEKELFHIIFFNNFKILFVKS